MPRHTFQTCCTLSTSRTPGCSHYRRSSFRELGSGFRIPVQASWPHSTLPTRRRLFQRHHQHPHRTQKTYAKDFGATRWWRARQQRRSTRREEAKTHRGNSCNFSGPGSWSPSIHHAQAGGADCQDQCHGRSDDPRHLKTISLETTRVQLDYNWITSCLCGSREFGETDASTQRHRKPSDCISFLAFCISHGCAGLGGREEDGARAGRSCPGYAGAVEGHHNFGQPSGEFRPPPGLGGQQSDFVQQGVPRSSETTARTGSTSRNVFPISATVYGKEDATCKGRRTVSGRASDKRSDSDSLCGEVWWLRPLQRHRMHDVADSYGDGPSSSRQHRGGEGQHCFDGSLPGAVCSGQWPDGCRPPLVPERRPSLIGVPKPLSHELCQGESICSLSGAEMGHNRFGLHQGDGSDCKQAARCDRRKARERSHGPAGSTAQESSQEVSQRRRKAEKPRTRARGGMNHDHVPEGQVPDAPPMHSFVPAEAPLHGTSTVPKILASMPRWILTSRTPFAALLAKSFSIQRCDASTPASVVFPLPLMDFDIFRGGGPKLSTRRWRTLLRKRFLHILILAINYIEGSLDFQQLPLLGRCPNSVQKKVHSRLRALVTACDSPETGELSLVPGRSGHEFIQQLEQLEHFAKGCPLINDKAYGAGPSDFEKKKCGVIGQDDSIGKSIQLYSSLNAERLKLVGTGQWHLEEWLDDLLYLPYIEPKILQRPYELDYRLGPNLDREDPDECLRLAKKWDDLGLLGLTHKRPYQDSFTRIFNALTDRLETGDLQTRLRDHSKGPVAFFHLVSSLRASTCLGVTAPMVSSLTERTFTTKVGSPRRELIPMSCPSATAKVHSRGQKLLSPSRCLPRDPEKGLMLAITLVGFNGASFRQMMRFSPRSSRFCKVITSVSSLPCQHIMDFWRMYLFFGMTPPSGAIILFLQVQTIKAWSLTTTLQ